MYIYSQLFLASINQDRKLLFYQDAKLASESLKLLTTSLLISLKTNAYKDHILLDYVADLLS